MLLHQSPQLLSLRVKFAFLHAFALDSVQVLRGGLDFSRCWFQVVKVFAILRPLR
ncbi:MAG: hypothetical protein WD768_01155 [Phycisphaeraceae bacterium]